jgi:hypothetical protein
MHVLLTSAVVGGEWSASCHRCFIPGEGASLTHWIGGWVDPRASLDDVEKWKFLTLQRLELWPVSLPVHSQSLWRALINYLIHHKKHCNRSRKFISQNCKGSVIVTFCLQAGRHQGESAWELSDFGARNLLFFSAHSAGWLLVLRVCIVSDAYNYYNWTAQFIRVVSCKIWGWLEECDVLGVMWHLMFINSEFWNFMLDINTYHLSLV